MGGYIKALRYLVWLTQLGLSVAVPLAGFILLGVLGAAGGLYNSFKTLNLMLKQDEEKPPKGFNRHD